MIQFFIFLSETPINKYEKNDRKNKQSFFIPYV